MNFCDRPAGQPANRVAPLGPEAAPLRSLARRVFALFHIFSQFYANFSFFSSPTYLAFSPRTLPTPFRAASLLSFPHNSIPSHGRIKQRCRFITAFYTTALFRLTFDSRNYRHTGSINKIKEISRRRPKVSFANYSRTKI